MSLAANVAAAPRFAWQPVLVAGWPPVALLLAVELLAHRSRSPRAETEPAAPTVEPAAPVAHPETTSPAETQRGTGHKSGRVLALAEVSPSTEREGEPTAQEIMWAHVLKERERGRIPTGAELDGVAGHQQLRPHGTAAVARARPPTRHQRHDPARERGCGKNAPLPPIPPGPADTTHPRRALARLALSAAYRDVADFAAGGVPTVSDAYGDAWDYVDHAARLLAKAQDVLARAVVYARERGGTWPTIAEALDTTEEQARDQWAPTLERWEDALDRPWERSGRFLVSRMPEGATEPEQTAGELDQWCLRHLDERDGARHNARAEGIEDRMVSATLPEHTPLTEMTSLTRTAAYLARRGAEATEAERDACQQRKARVLATLNAAAEVTP